jgi:hypothetical protein
MADLAYVSPQSVKWKAPRCKNRAQNIGLNRSKDMLFRFAVPAVYQGTGHIGAPSAKSNHANLHGFSPRILSPHSSTIHDAAPYQPTWNHIGFSIEHLDSSRIRSAKSYTKIRNELSSPQGPRRFRSSYSRARGAPGDA